jgi:hypothetical protein
MEALAATPHLQRAHLFTPEVARDLYFDDGPSPILAFQLYFSRLEHLEAAIGEGGNIHGVGARAWPSLEGATVTHQAMWTRPFPVPEANRRVSPVPCSCSYLVHYPGAAEDFNVWLRYYLSHHPQIMYFFPGVREIEIFTRMDWCDAMPWQRVEYMQRNKLVFDSAAALTEALNSPVRHDMHADRLQFPPFTGSNLHFPMETATFVGPAVEPEV